MADLDTVLRDYSDRLDRWLCEVLPEPTPATERFYEMIRYHLGWIDEHGQPSSSASSHGQAHPPSTSAAGV